MTGLARKALFFALSILILSFPVALYSRDFTIADFEPADPSQVDDYYNAVNELIDDLMVIATDGDGNELFRIVPFPVELVALMTQLRIHEENITDPDELATVIELANLSKPSTNSFGFILDGDPDWLTRDVRVCSYASAESDEREVVPVYEISEVEESDGGTASLACMVAFDDVDQMFRFLSAERVVMVVGDEEVGDAMTLDCGFWRQWGLLDLREAEPAE